MRLTNRTIGRIAGGGGAFLGVESYNVLRWAFWPWYTHSMVTMLCFPLVAGPIGLLWYFLLNWILRRIRCEREMPEAKPPAA
jgi:hypothetical protein